MSWIEKKLAEMYLGVVFLASYVVTFLYVFFLFFSLACHNSFLETSSLI
jgi:hypothetical protein